MAADFLGSVRKRMRPELDIEVLDPYTFFKLFQEYYGFGDNEK